MNKLYLFLISFLLIMSASATKVTTGAQNSLIINSWDEHNAITDQTYTILWDVADLNGNILNKTQVNCSFFVYESGSFGYFIAGPANKTTVGEAWYKMIPNNFINKTSLYNYQIDCVSNINSTISGSYLANFRTTPTSIVLTTDKSLLYISILVLAIIIFFSTLVGGMLIPADNKRDEMTGYIIALSNLKYLKIFCYAISYVMLMLIFYFSYIISFAFLEMDFLSTLFRFGFYFLVVALFPLFVVGVYIVIANAVRDHKVGEMLSGGLRIR